MAEHWTSPRRDEGQRTTTLEERGKLLVDLLELADALPPAPRRPLDTPSFRHLCEQR